MVSNVSGQERCHVCIFGWQTTVASMWALRSVIKPCARLWPLSQASIVTRVLICAVGCIFFHASQIIQPCPNGYMLLTPIAFPLVFDDVIAAQDFGSS